MKPKKGDVKTERNTTWTVEYVTVGGDIIIRVHTPGGTDYRTTVSGQEWAEIPEKG